MAREPKISVGVMAARERIEFHLLTSFGVNSKGTLSPGHYRARLDRGRVSLLTHEGRLITRDRLIRLLPRRFQESRLLLRQIPIGRGFHWEERQDLTLQGEFQIQCSKGKELQVISWLPLEMYLSSVIGSEMSGTAPLEFLKAHAVISRSWAMRIMEGKGSVSLSPSSTAGSTEDTILRWTGTEIHQGFDVCADDHCQRYRGFLEETARNTESAVRETRGEILTYKDEICDTRYSKCCGGMTENFSTAWADQNVPYLRGLHDNDRPSPGFSFPLSEEKNAEAWITGSPEAFCKTRNREILETVLSPLDRRTSDFYRWETSHSQDEICGIVTQKTGRPIGWIRDLFALERGASGRISRLRIVGTARTLTVGKELEIRRILSPTHLYSSALVIKKEGGEREGIPSAFRLTGAGWGHGVGLCQIGAAVMATHGRTYREILRHYFPNTNLSRRYGSAEVR